MSKLKELIAELCPDGVEFRSVESICDISTASNAPKKSVLVQSDECQIPIISNGVGINAFRGYTNEFKIDKPAVTITARGTIGHAEYRNYPYFPVYSLLSVIPKNYEVLDAKYLYYCLQGKEYNLPASGIPQLTISMFKGTEIPIPPVEIQREIVRILDKFSDSNDGLISLLQRELILRKKQYEFYRDQLLTFNSDVEFKSIESVSKILTPKIKIKSNDYLSEGIYPVIDQGQKFIGGYTNATNVFPKGEYVIFGDHTCIVKFVDFEFAQGADGIKIIQTKSDEILPKFLYYCMSNVRMESSYARHWSKMKSIEIPIPSIEVQRKIVEILDRFDKLCNDLTSGIPAEIQARQKQYEYYRDKLLTFKIKEEFD